MQKKSIKTCQKYSYLKQKNKNLKDKSQSCFNARKKLRP